MSRFKTLTIVFVCLTVLATPAFAQDDEEMTEYVPEDEINIAGDQEGLDGTLQVSASTNLVDNRNVVGQTDGFSALLGLSLLSGLDYVHGRHQIRNTLKVTETFSKTPVIPQLIKSDDVVDFESLYNYFLLSWFGGFGRFSLDTNLFASEALRAEPTNYAIESQNPDGTTSVELREDIERLRLADPFKPLSLNESLGVFAEPVQSTPFSLSTRVGFGLRQTFAQGVLAVQDDEATENQIEVQDLTNPESDITVFQGGLEGFLGVGGSFDEQRVTYSVGSTVLVPFINNDAQDRTATELARLGVVATVGVSVFEWMSVNYKFRLTRDPQLLDEIQLQNSLLLTFDYTFIDTDAAEEETPEPTVSQEEFEAAQERAEEAEARAQEAEEQAAELQEQLEAEQDTEPAPEPAPTPEPEPEPTPEP